MAFTGPELLYFRANPFHDPGWVYRCLYCRCTAAVAPPAGFSQLRPLVASASRRAPALSASFVCCRRCLCTQRGLHGMPVCPASARCALIRPTLCPAPAPTTPPPQAPLAAGAARGAGLLLRVGPLHVCLPAAPGRRLCALLPVPHLCGSPQVGGWVGGGPTGSAAPAWHDVALPCACWAEAQAHCQWQQGQPAGPCSALQWLPFLPLAAPCAATLQPPDSQGEVLYRHPAGHPGCHAWSGAGGQADLPLWRRLRRHQVGPRSFQGAALGAPLLLPALFGQSVSRSVHIRAAPATIAPPHRRRLPRASLLSPSLCLPPACQPLQRSWGVGGDCPGVLQCNGTHGCASPQVGWLRAGGQCSAVQCSTRAEWSSGSRPLSSLL